MPKRSKELSDTTPPSSTQTSDRFQDEVEKVLKHFHDPRWLGQQSPLATPYFLGDAGQDASTDTDDSTRLGLRLQQQLRQAAETVTSQDSRHGDFRKKLLHLRYFDSKERTETQIVDTLGTSVAALHRHRIAVIEQLANELIRRLKPALRLESPPVLALLVGREAMIEHCLAALAQRKSITLHGMGGVGKTALATTIAQHFAPQTTFWYTITPGLNDQPHSLLFALARFLQQQGASTLWSQLVADKGEIKQALALNL